MKIRSFYQDWGILLNYGISLISIILAVVLHLHWIILIPIFCFLLHDIDFVFNNSESNFESRKPVGTVESIRAASNYISYFIALIGVFIGLSSKDWGSLKNILNESLWIKTYALILVVLSGVSLLFIPVRYFEKNVNQPSKALKNCFLIVLFFEKVIIVLLVYVLIFIVNSQL